MDLLINIFLHTHAIDKMWKVENNEIQTHTKHNEHQDMISEILSGEKTTIR